MSSHLQGLSAGLVTGLFIYIYNRNKIWASYEDVERNIVQFNLSINPYRVIDQPKALDPKERKKWLVTHADDSTQSSGRRPGDAWNRYVRYAYRQVAEKYF